ncbi:hypothetical protein ACFQ1I_24870 [Kitasatospora arboriphila]
MRTALGEELIGIRRSFLSEHAVRRSYLGYATQQFRKLTTRDTTDPAARARAAKHARHLVRLVEQGLALHETGEVTVRLADPERVRALGERYAERPEEAAGLLASAEARFDRPGVLPRRPTRPRPRPGCAGSGPSIWTRRPDARPRTGSRRGAAHNPLAAPRGSPGRIGPGERCTSTVVPAAGR